MVEFYHQIKQTAVTKTNITYESKQQLFYDLSESLIDHASKTLALNFDK